MFHSTFDHLSLERIRAIIRYNTGLVGRDWLMFIKGCNHDDLEYYSEYSQKSSFAPNKANEIKRNGNNGQNITR
jgi:hypothetical protein